MRRYRQRPGVRDRELERKRDYDAFFRAENRARWKAHNEKPKRRRAKAAWYKANAARIAAERKTRKDYAAKFGPVPKGYVIPLEDLAASVRTGRDKLAGLRKRLAAASRRRSATMKANAKVNTKARKERREQQKIYKSFVEKFGYFEGFVNYALMRKSLKTGHNHLVDENARIAALHEKHQREHPEEFQPLDSAKAFTAETERDMTNFIKKRRLFEGACNLPWADYFAFREANKCARLTVGDERYAGLYSSCAIPQKKI